MGGVAGRLLRARPPGPASSEDGEDGVLAGGDTSEWNALGPVRRRLFVLEAPPASAGRGAGVERPLRRTPSGDRLEGTEVSRHRHPWPSTSGGPGRRVFGPDARVERCRGGVRPGPCRAGADVFAGPRGISEVPVGLPHGGAASARPRWWEYPTEGPLRAATGGQGEHGSTAPAVGERREGRRDGEDPSFPGNGGRRGPWLSRVRPRDLATAVGCSGSRSAGDPDWRNEGPGLR